MLVIIVIFHELFLLFQDQHSVVGQGAGPTPSSSSCSNPNTGSGYMNSSQQSMLNQQLMEKKQALQRQMMEQKQLLLQQQMLAEAVSFLIPFFYMEKLILETIEKKAKTGRRKPTKLWGHFGNAQTFQSTPHIFQHFAKPFWILFQFIWNNSSIQATVVSFWEQSKYILNLRHMNIVSGFLCKIS